MQPAKTIDLQTPNVARPSPLAATRSQVARLQVPLGYVVVGALALGLRLWFVIGVNKVPTMWDARSYWEEAQAVHDAICRQLATCMPDAYNGPATDLPSALQRLVLTHMGLQPTMMGALMTLFPAQLLTGLLVNVLLDSLVCLMLVGIMRRWGAPLWAAMLAGLLQAIYIPAITGDGAFLQQPPIRFLLALLVWAYTHAFTRTGRTVPHWVALGSFAALLLGFTNLTDRPLLWLAQLTVLGLALVGRPFRAVRNSQLVCLALTIAVIVTVGLLLSGQARPDSWFVSTTGLSSQGTAQGQTTVLSFPNFWPPDKWPSLNVNATKSVAGDFARAPFDFVQWWGYSLLSNWRYPDYLYFQQFLLDLRWQSMQHIVMVFLGLGGLAGLLGFAGPRRRLCILILALGGYVSLTSSVISVEPRRLSVLSPFLALGVASLVWGTVAARPWAQRWPRWSKGVLVAVVLVWAVPLSVLVALFPDEAGVAHTVRALVSLGVLALAMLSLLALAKRFFPAFRPLLPAALLAVVTIMIGIGQLLDTDWRVWSISATAAAPARQQVRSWTLPPNSQPWLLLDTTTPDAATGAAIYLNGELVKPRGTPLFNWQAHLWYPYNDLASVSNVTEPRRTWLATPLPGDLVHSTPMTVEVVPGQSPLVLWGDYLDAPDGGYFGPSMDPAHAGFSFWRWQWNAVDPRIPAPQPFEGRGYSIGDTKPTANHPPGLYRIFLIGEPFGPRTNALPPVSASVPPPGNTAPCQVDQVVAGGGVGRPFVCQVLDHVRYYTPGGILIGVSPDDRFGRPPRYTLVDTMTTPAGRVDVVSLGGDLFSANFYGPDNTLTYSAVFPH